MLVIYLYRNHHLKEVFKTNSNENIAFDVDFMSCVADKADNLRVTESDSHFSEFTGVHPSKINQGKLELLDILLPKDREPVIQKLCKKHSPYAYLDFYIKKSDGEYVLVHCIAQNIADSTLCRITLADVSQSRKKSEMLQKRAAEMNSLIDLVEGGVCLFKVTQDMHFEALYMNKACARFFDTAAEMYLGKTYRLDELIHPDDKSKVYQAVGNTMATKKPINMEIRVRQHKDKCLWVKLDSAIQSVASDGSPIFHAVFSDISAIKKAEEKADTERDTMINIFKHMPGPLFTADAKTPFILDVVSEDFIKLIGYTRKELFEGLGGDLTHLIVPEDTARAEKELIEGAKTQDTVKTIYTLRLKNKKLINVVDKRKTVDSGDGEKTTIGIIREASAIKIDEQLGL